MWWKLILNSFRRDLRRKGVGIAAVALATCLATFLLNWSLNLGDKIQKDLRAYGANILITPQGESLPLISGNTDLGFVTTDRFLKSTEISKLNDIFWRNQIVAYAPMLPRQVRWNGQEITLVGTEYGDREAVASFQNAAPYLALQGRWPSSENEAVIGSDLSKSIGKGIGQKVAIDYANRRQSFTITGIVRSGGAEERQLFTKLSAVQKLTGREGEFKQLLVSALVSPQNQLYYDYQRNPRSLSPTEFERYSCTPYVTSVAGDITKVFTGSEARIVRRISQTEEKISSKVNWLMLLVTLAALVASSLTMTSTTTAMILERKKELALMKAIGSRNGFLVFYLLTEVIILGLIGSVVGYALGSGLSMALSHSIFQSAFQLKWVVLPLVALVGIMIILFGSVWPLRHAISLQPARALKDL